MGGRLKGYKEKLGCGAVWDEKNPKALGMDYKTLEERVFGHIVHDTIYGESPVRTWMKGNSSTGRHLESSYDSNIKYWTNLGDDAKRMVNDRKLNELYTKIGKLVYKLSNTEGVMLSICRDEEFSRDIPEGGYDYCMKNCPDSPICILKQEIKNILEKSIDNTK